MTVPSQLQTLSIKTGAWSHCEGLPAQKNYLLQAPRFKLILIHILQLVIWSLKKKKEKELHPNQNCDYTGDLVSRASLWKIRNLCGIWRRWKDLAESQCAWIVLWQLLEFLLLLIRFLTGDNQRVRVAHRHLKQQTPQIFTAVHQRYSANCTHVVKQTLIQMHGKRNYSLQLYTYKV